MIHLDYRLAFSATLLLLPIFAFAQETNGDNEDKSQEVMDEVIVEGHQREERTVMREDTELLLNVAGAGLDPLMSIMSLPGVTFANDYSSEPAVRGSAPEDNAYYIDLIPAHYIFHIFGNSIFNHNLIYSFDLYPAAFSSQYGNATGAVIDVGLRDPKVQEFTTTLDASFILTSGMIETGIGDNHAVYASYRRSLIDKFIKAEDATDEDSGIDIDQIPIADDYQIKYVWYPSDQQQLSFVAAGASDEVGATFRQMSNAALRDPDLTGPARVETRFDSQGLIWTWRGDEEESQLNTLLTRSVSRDDISWGTGQFSVVDSERVILRSQWETPLGNRHRLLIGASIEDTDHDLSLNAKIPTCSRFDPDCPTLEAALVAFNDHVIVRSHTAYLQDAWTIVDDLLTLTGGVHYSGDDYLEQAQTELRMRLDLQLGKNWGLYLAGGQYSQLPELQEISPATGNPNLEYLQADHYVLGVNQQFGDGWSWNVDLYYKKLSNLVLSLHPARDPDYALLYANDASGEAAGVEFLLEKELTEKLYGWVAVSLSKTERKNDRTGETKDFDYDKPVIINVVGNYKLTEHWLMGLRWSLQSGGLYTPIVDVQPNATNSSVMEPVYGELNSERLPFYHRLDLRVEYTRPTGFGMWSFFVDVLNAYNADNVQGYRYAPNGNDTINSTPDGFGSNVPVSESEGLGFFPSVGFKIQF